MEENRDFPEASQDVPGQGDFVEIFPPARPGKGPPATDSNPSGLDSPPRRLDLDSDWDLAKLEALCEERLRAQAFLIDTTRLLEHAIARTSYHRPSADRTGQDWLANRVDEAINDLLLEDRSADLTAEIVEDHTVGLFTRTMLLLGVEAGLSRLAARRFNGLPRSTRVIFFAYACDQLTTQECISRGLGTRTTLGQDLNTGIEALLMYEQQPDATREEPGNE